MECAGTTALWNDAICRVGGKRRHVAALQTLNQRDAGPMATAQSPFATFAPVARLPPVLTLNSKLSTINCFIIFITREYDTSDLKENGTIPF